MGFLRGAAQESSRSASEAFWKDFGGVRTAYWEKRSALHHERLRRDELNKIAYEQKTLLRYETALGLA